MSADLTVSLYMVVLMVSVLGAIFMGRPLNGRVAFNIIFWPVVIPAILLVVGFKAVRGDFSK